MTGIGVVAILITIGHVVTQPNLKKSKKEQLFSHICHCLVWSSLIEQLKCHIRVCLFNLLKALRERLSHAAAKKVNYEWRLEAQKHTSCSKHTLSCMELILYSFCGELRCSVTLCDNLFSIYQKAEVNLLLCIVFVYKKDFNFTGNSEDQSLAVYYFSVFENNFKV